MNYISKNISKGWLIVTKKSVVSNFIIFLLDPLLLVQSPFRRCFLGSSPGMADDHTLARVRWLGFCESGSWSFPQLGVYSTTIRSLGVPLTAIYSHFDNEDRADRLLNNFSLSRDIATFQRQFLQIIAKELAEVDREHAPVAGGTFPRLLCSWLLPNRWFNSHS